ncbi:MAG: metalloregulator ArsR/SmtB family transcription factor [Myxococcota bacterium]
MVARAEDVDILLRALADPTRRAVIERLVQGPASVSELAAPFDMTLPSFVRHVRLLEEAGLVHTAKEGRVRTCELAPARLAVVEDWLGEQRRLWEGRLDRFDAYVRRLHAERQAAAARNPAPTETEEEDP